MLTLYDGKMGSLGLPTSAFPLHTSHFSLPPSHFIPPTSYFPLHRFQHPPDNLSKISPVVRSKPVHVAGFGFVYIVPFIVSNIAHIAPVKTGYNCFRNLFVCSLFQIDEPVRPKNRREYPQTPDRLSAKL